MITGEKYFIDALNAVPADIKMMVDMSMDISEKIANTLKEKGLTQKDFAKMMGKDNAEITRWLSGTHNFTLRTLSKISTALDIDLISV